MKLCALHITPNKHYHASTHIPFFFIQSHQYLKLCKIKKYVFPVDMADSLLNQTFSALAQRLIYL